MLILKLRSVEVPPPGAGLVTEISAVPTELTSAAVTVTTRLLLLMNCVVFGVPFHWTTELGKKPVPCTVSGKSAAPTETDVGVVEVIVGTGYTTDNGIVADVPPPGAGFTTDNCSVPTAARSETVPAN